MPTRKLEAALADLARRRHGAVTREELLALGFTAKMIERRIASGLLVPVHPGVYLVGLGPPSPLAYEAAALLACRPGAFLSFHTAARLSRLPTSVNDGIHATVVGRWRRSLEGVIVHSIGELAPDELGRHEGLPISSPSLTLLDLAGVLGLIELGNALNEARVQRLVTDGQLRATLEAHPKRRGARKLAKLLDSERGPRSRWTATAITALRSGLSTTVGVRRTLPPAASRSTHSPGTIWDRDREWR